MPKKTRSFVVPCLTIFLSSCILLLQTVCTERTSYRLLWLMAKAWMLVPHAVFGLNLMWCRVNERSVRIRFILPFSFNKKDLF